MAPPSFAPPSAQYFAPHGNQSMRQPPPQSGPLPSQSVGGSSFPAGGGLAGAGLSNSNASGDWLGAEVLGLLYRNPKTPRASVGGNAITSATMFGGDLFSASHSISKPSLSSIPTQTVSIPPVSSAIAPVTSEPQTSAKIDPLGALNAFTRQPTGAPVQLKQVWDLSDQDNDSMLSLREFCVALYLMERYREGQNLPPTLPSNVLLDETLLSYGPTQSFL
ncbi:hypothetical protein CTI12_AA457930 [Artemisia annua]|uniref:Calcium-binding EF hand family protein n=1 Tax=Artemisia annua TaxID=35608 RepID=A0A2U1LTD1_ARTAN|nr:hypothetical protein CTI12_AA457930 [Artemisia annua]